METAKRVLPLAIDTYLDNLLIKFITKFGNKYYFSLALSSQTGEALIASYLLGSVSYYISALRLQRTSASPIF